MATAEAIKKVQKVSRTGKRAIKLDQGVSATINGQRVTVKGPKGEIERSFPAHVVIEQKDGALLVSPVPGSGQLGTQHQGTTRAVLANMVEGVVNSFKASLDFRGVGYRAELKDGNLKMTVGMSHQPELRIPDGLSLTVEQRDEAGTKYPRVHLESVDKELVGRIAARIRSVRPPEPYNGKGIRYTGERIRQKAGKSGK